MVTKPKPSCHKCNARIKSWDDHYCAGCLALFAECPHRLPPYLGYLAWHADADERTARGEKQKKCPNCGLYIWEEFWMLVPWRAVYKIKCKKTDAIRTVEYYVVAATAGDVPGVIRDEMNFDNASVEEAEVKRMTEPKVIISRHLDGPVGG